VALALGTLCAGCAAVDWVRDRHEGQSSAAKLVARADELARDGRPGAARDLYDRVVGEATRDSVHARALYNLARLYVDPSSGLRDYRAAQVAFDRLLTEYPKGEWEADARTWRAALTELLMREAEAARVKANLQRLRGIDLNLERRH
jgi:tetratricopeptide (TPR) repeat protein